MNVVKIRKSGTFYQVFDNDIYIFYYLFNYNIKNNKVGFPKSVLNCKCQHQNLKNVKVKTL